MTDKERREDDVLKNCIQEAYGISDEQLLAELDEIEATLSDDEFVGVEDRIYEKIVEKEGITFSHELTPTKTVFTGKFSKRKKWLIVGLAATFVAGVGINTIGSNNYFLQQRNKPDGIVLNSGQNIIATGELEDAYKEIETAWGVPVLKLNYIPSDVKFEQLEMMNNQATFVFSFGSEKIYCIQTKESREISTGINSDRDIKEEKVFNDWISQDVELKANDLGNGNIEYSALVYVEDISCRIVGKLPKDEMVKIVKRLNFN